MIFNLANMVTALKTIDGISFTDRAFFEYFFESLALKMRPNEDPLKFGYSRVSEFMSRKEPLYESVSKLAYEPETKSNLLEMTHKAKKELFNNTNIMIIDDALRKMTIDDSVLSKEIDSLYNEKQYYNVFVEYVLYAMKIEYKERQLRKKYKIATGNFLTKKADATICSEIIEQIIRNGKLKKENIKHERAWSLEDKMNVNSFNDPLKERILECFDDFETVMTAIDNLSMIETQARKTLYSSYRDAYSRVLSNILGDDCTEDNIKRMSSTIFIGVDDYIYEKMLKGKIKIEQDIVRYNLFCVTVVVFYQCKFLLKVGEEVK